MGKDLLPGKYEGMSRRKFIGIMGVYGITLAISFLAGKYASAQEFISIKELQRGEDVFSPYLSEVRKLLAEAEVPMSDKNIVVTGGRVRAGYEIGQVLFEKADPKSFRGILHIIGERPGTMHHSYSV